MILHLLVSIPPLRRIAVVVALAGALAAIPVLAPPAAADPWTGWMWPGPDGSTGVVEEERHALLPPVLAPRLVPAPRVVPPASTAPLTRPGVTVPGTLPQDPDGSGCAVYAGLPPEYASTGWTATDASGSLAGADNTFRLSAYEAGARLANVIVGGALNDCGTYSKGPLGRFVVDVRLETGSVWATAQRIVGHAAVMDVVELKQWIAFEGDGVRIDAPAGWQAAGPATITMSSRSDSRPRSWIDQHGRRVTTTEAAIGGHVEGVRARGSRIRSITHVAQLVVNGQGVTLRSTRRFE